MDNSHQIFTLATLPDLPQNADDASVRGIASVTETRKILKQYSHSTERPILLHIHQTAPRVAPDHTTDMSYSVRGCLKVTPKQANEFLTEYYEKSGVSGIGGYVQLSIAHNMIFVGGC